MSLETQRKQARRALGVEGIGDAWGVTVPPLRGQDGSGIGEKRRGKSPPENPAGSSRRGD